MRNCMRNIKLLIKEIKTCWQCPYFESAMLDSIRFCYYKMIDRSTIGKPLTGQEADNIPPWCPLPDANKNEELYEKRD